MCLLYLDRPVFIDYIDHLESLYDEYYLDYEVCLGHLEYLGCLDILAYLEYLDYLDFIDHLESRMSRLSTVYREYCD